MKTLLHICLGAFALLSISFAQVPDFGAQTVPLGAAKAKELKLKAGTGAKVVEIFEGSDAEELGLERDDIVTHLGKRPLRNVTSLSELLAAMADVGDEVKLKWVRDGKAMSGSVELTEEATSDEIVKRYGAGGAVGGIAGLEGLEDLPGLGGLDLGALLQGAGGVGQVEVQGFMLGPDGKMVPLKDGELPDGFDFDLAEGADGEEMQKQLQEQLQKAFGGLELDFEELGEDGGGAFNGFSASVTSIMETDDGTVSHTKKGNDKHTFKFKDADGKLQWKGTISEDELDEVPEAHRDTARELMKGGIGGFLGGGELEAVPGAGKDLKELLKGLKSGE